MCPSHSYAEGLIPSVSEYTVFENRIAADVTSIGHTGIGGPLIPHDWGPYKKRNLEGDEDTICR